MIRLPSKRFLSIRRPSPPSPPLIRIENATFYRNHPDSHPEGEANPPIYPNLNFTLPATSTRSQHWAILSPSSANRTAFLQVLRGHYLSVPASARSYPYLQTREIANKDPRLRNPTNAIKYVGMDAERGGLSSVSTKGAYMSARYESMREVTDWSVRDYLMGNTELNADETLAVKPPEEMVERVMNGLNLTTLQNMPVSHLSNGQTRRARIAKALLDRPELLLLDGPFMGLDPHTLQYLSGLLHRIAATREPRMVLSLRPQDVIPDWITNFVVVGDHPKVSVIGDRQEVFEFLRMHRPMGQKGPKVVDPLDDTRALSEIAQKMAEKGDFDGPTVTRKAARDTFTEEIPLGDPVVQMGGVQIRYNDSATPVLGDWEGGLRWEVRKGQRWGVFGPNGSGKTTLLALITSDHPQAYSAPVKLFGRSRLPTPGSPGISIFEVQSKMGHSSPEVHTYFPKHLTVRRALQSAWADTPVTKPRLDAAAEQKVDACLRWFRAELWPEAEGDSLDWADTQRFRDLAFSAQRLALFLRAIIKSPDLVILDEAFSGMDEPARDKCLRFLHHGDGVYLHGLTPDQALIVVAHDHAEVPHCVREFITLPEAGAGVAPRVGRLDGPLAADRRRWSQVWGTEGV
ncbi:uncharacterized protein K452DRAFT_354445 [Aplosporella prunicola CBS 121167]|uniref:ABC transporter domain-containing protein n=1 Tax=Aplosporella prunicola CBS 121167 TaxID=1176127 RepID=A0A6A6AVQ9_9PEZI|nr:uncharacterized protein K452DRAFT_354445 [Aplosporella prunicola CBS 121167]KAF2135273.1 hypothetical protein K452DRAFT_354445 [Aplosporella prunicola CBS 121167]